MSTIQIDILNDILNQFYEGDIPPIQDIKVLFNNGTTISLRWKDEADTRLIKALHVDGSWKVIVKS